MSVIEECYEAAYEAARAWYPGKPSWAEIKDDTLSSLHCAEHYQVMVDAVLTTLAGKLDEDGLEAGFKAAMEYTMSSIDDTLPKTEAAKIAVGTAIQAYLNQLINEEKE